MSHDIAIRAILQSLAKVFPGESHDTDTIFRRQILFQIFAAEIENT